MTYQLLVIIVVINAIGFINSTILYVNVSFTAVWAENATTVAGLSNGTAGSTNNTLNSPRGLSISRDDILYIAEWNNYRIVVVNLTSLQVINIIGSGPGSAIYQFDHPYDVIVVDESLYVYDAWNLRIQKWSTSGTNPSNILTGSFGHGFYMFKDKYDKFYISAYDDNMVVRFAPNSSVAITVAGNGVVGSLSYQLNSPDGIFVDDNLTLYIADFNNHRIQMWKYQSLYGITVAGNGTSGSSLKQLFRPGAVVVDTNGYMYIADSGNNRILRWKLGSDSGICIAACTGTTGTQMNQLYSPASIAFDSSGSLYTSDYYNNRVQKFQFLYNANQTTTTGQSIATVPTSSTLRITTKSTTKITTTKRSLMTSTTNNSQKISAFFTLSGTTIMRCYLVFMTLYYNY
ncbi:unnamed protein product [Adineta steineri]|uniref:NHL repeat containing protein n=1 Tax=Adineta steineri TaxID=433720 RepID=A0A814DC64_9BILA|nr:unnamed protein product [Adineta steineri]CAF3702104.1 unnamed protein product [Adineta steineri]